MSGTPELLEKTDLAVAFIKEIEAAIKRFNMYPSGHPAVRAAAEIPYKTLKQLLSREEQVIINLLEGKLTINGRPVEGLMGKVILVEALSGLNLSSISFTSEMDMNGFQAFLQYFVGKTGGKIEWNDLRNYATENAISGLGVDVLHYELVGKDQEVVDKEALFMKGSSEAMIKSIMGQYPEMVLGLLCNKTSIKSGLSVKYAAAIDFAKLGQNLEEEIGHLNDEQIMNIVVAGLKENIGSAGECDEVDVQENLYKIFELMEKHNQAELLPKIRRIVEELHMIDARYLDLILDKRYSRKRLAFDELESARANLEQGKVDAQKFGMISKRLEIYGEEDYTHDFLNGLAEKINSGGQVWQQAATAFDLITAGAVKDSSMISLNEIYTQIRDNLRKYELPNDKFNFYLKEAARLAAWMTERENLSKFRELLDVISVYTSKDLMIAAEKKQGVLDFYEQIGTNELAGRLLKHLEKSFETLSRDSYEILRHLRTQAVALLLCEHLSHTDRAIRLFIIRVLSEFGPAATRAFGLILADRKLTERPEGQTYLLQESWFRLRNMVLISGNLATEEALDILEGFASDPDPRMAEEIIMALEKIKSEKACAMLTSYLYFNDSRLRLKAAVALSNAGCDDCLDKLIDAFGQEAEVKLAMMPIIARVGQEKSLPFFRQLIFGQRDSAMKSFLGKSGDEFRLQIISALSKIPSPDTLTLLDEYKATLGRGLGSLFKSNRVLMALEGAQRSLQAKMAGKPADFRK